MDTAWRTSSYSSNGSNCVQVSWRKASYSSNGTSCVELAGDLAAVRDSKNPGGPILRVDLRPFVRAVKHECGAPARTGAPHSPEDQPAV
ncbi:MAG TPA: DUF397 domain-containing protein [Pseudonocardiaceae bacterium]|jgi:hypothetical protein